jgi:hypothetical protein
LPEALAFPILLEEAPGLERKCLGCPIQYMRIYPTNQ